MSKVIAISLPSRHSGAFTDSATINWSHVKVCTGNYARLFMRRVIDTGLGKISAPFQVINEAQFENINFKSFF